MASEEQHCLGECSSCALRCEVRVQARASKRYHAHIRTGSVQHTLAKSNIAAKTVVDSVVDVLAVKKFTKGRVQPARSLFERTPQSWIGGSQQAGE